MARHNTPRDRGTRDLRARLASEDGWILVPAFILMTVVLALGFALLMVVDRQTSEAKAKRTSDAAQALTDGVASSAGKALASFDTLASAGLAAAFPSQGGCQLIRGTLTGGPEAAAPGETSPQAVARNVRNAVKQHFDETNNEYVRNSAEATKWSVNICPDRTDGSDVWDDQYLNQSVTTPSAAPRRAVWVRAQADVRATASTVSSRSRASAIKVRQANAPFLAPEDLAIGAASFSTDLGTGVTSLLQDGLVGKLVLQGLLGQGKLIQNDTAKIGLRCGLLDVLDNPGLNLCLNGALGGVNSVMNGATNTLNLGDLGNQLGGILGTNRTVNLGDYNIAPDRARAAFKALALSSGTYVNAVAGDVAGSTGASTSCFASPATNEAGISTGTVLTAANTAGKVVYIRQVGDGGTGTTDPFCTVPANISPAVLVIERGGARVTTDFTGVLYAANRQEVDGATTADEVAAKRKSARLRETIRIEQPGKVTGAVWTDGAGGQAGLYPMASQPTKTALLSVGGEQGICSLPVLGPVVNALGQTLQGVLDFLGNTVGGLLSGYQYRSVYGNMSGCDLMKGILGNLTTSQLIKVFGTGETNKSVVVSERRKCTGPIVLGACVGSFGPWEPAETKQFDIPSLLSNLAAPNVLDQVLGTLGATLTNWTAVDRNIDRIRLANVGMAVGSEPVPGTYRSVQPLASLVQGGA